MGAGPQGLQRWEEFREAQEEEAQCQLCDPKPQTLTS